jgi:hypothetical protein
MKEYIMHEIGLQEDDILYLFSDGHSDLSGKHKGKKIQCRIFRNILSDQAGKSAEKQRRSLEETYSRWKGVYSQSGNVPVPGVKGLNKRMALKREVVLYLI